MIKFPFVRPTVPPPQSWQPYLQGIYERRYFTNFGPIEQEFSNALATRYAAADAGVTLACNCTVGLTAGLIAFGVRGKVAVPAFTFPATLQAIIGAGCEPLLCDVDPRTWEMSAGSLEHMLKRRDVSALMPVRAYGFMRDFEPLLALARRYNLPVVIDAAASLGVAPLSADEQVMQVVSLHATKPFGIGEGGAIFSSSSMKKRLRQILNFGLDDDKRFALGLNGKMTEIQAAIGLALMPEIERIVARRQSMSEWYGALFSGFPDLMLPDDPGPTSWSTYPVLMPQNVDCRDFEAKASVAGLQLRRYYSPSLGEGFKDAMAPLGDTPIANDLSSRMICFPVYSDASPAELEEIGTIVRRLLRSV